MKTLIRAILILSLAFSSFFAVHAQTKTYLETRKILLKIDRAPVNKSLAKLFEESTERRANLIHALYDSDHHVSLNAQVILKYAADSLSLSAIETWYFYRQKRGENYWQSPIKIISEVKYLDGKNRDVAKLVLSNLYAESKEVSAKVVAYNKQNDTALVEVMIGNVFTEGWHVVVRQEEGKWRLLSNSLVWQS